MDDHELVLRRVDVEICMYRESARKLNAWLHKYGDNLLCRIFYVSDIVEHMFARAVFQALLWQGYRNTLEVGAPPEIVSVLDRIIDRFKPGFFSVKIWAFLPTQHAPLALMVWDIRSREVVRMRRLQARYKI